MLFAPKVLLQSSAQLTAHSKPSTPNSDTGSDQNFADALQSARRPQLISQSSNAAKSPTTPNNSATQPLPSAATGAKSNKSSKSDNSDGTAANSDASADDASEPSQATPTQSTTPASSTASDSKSKSTSSGNTDASNQQPQASDPSALQPPAPTTILNTLAATAVAPITKATTSTTTDATTTTTDAAASSTIAATTATIATTSAATATTPPKSTVPNAPKPAISTPVATTSSAPTIPPATPIQLATTASISPQKLPAAQTSQDAQPTPVPDAHTIAKSPEPDITKLSDKSASTTSVSPSLSQTTGQTVATADPSDNVSTPAEPNNDQSPNPKQSAKTTTSSAQLADAADSAAQLASTAQSTSPATAPTPALAAEIAPILTPIQSSDTPAPRTDSAQSSILATPTATTRIVDHRADPAVPAQNSPRPESDHTFDQIVLGLRAKVDAANTKAEISLNPPNLGTLHVSVSLENGSLTAQFQSSSDVVRDLLKGNMDKLKSVLESQGVTVDKLAVGAPTDKTETATAAPATPQTNQSANDGRSAGQYNREQSSGQKRSKDTAAFARAWREATNEAAPIDLVA